MSLNIHSDENLSGKTQIL